MAVKNNNDKIYGKFKEITDIEGLDKEYSSILCDIFKIVIDKPNQSTKDIAENCKKIVEGKK